MTPANQTFWPVHRILSAPHREIEAPLLQGLFGIFAQLREGFTCNEIAAEEGVNITRIRQIVSKELEQRSVYAAPSTPSCNWSVWRP